jgi:HK97 family phage prohead protease
MGDTISAAGWDISDFMRNPVALWAHDSSAPPIGRASNVRVEGGRLMGDIEFASASVYEFADTIYRLALGKFINAVSVGFLPIRYQFVDNDPDRGFGIDFLEQTLLEISVCPVPANPNALAEARAKGIDTTSVARWAAGAMRRGSTALLSGAQLKSLHASASGPWAQRSGIRAPGLARPETTADRVARAAGWAERLKGSTLPVHQHQPPLALTPHEQLAEDDRARRAAGADAVARTLAWW